MEVEVIKVVEVIMVVGVVRVTRHKSQDLITIDVFFQLRLLLNLHCIYAACLSKRKLKRSNQSKVPSMNNHCFVFLSLLSHYSSTVFTRVQILDCYSKLCQGARSLL